MCWHLLRLIFNQGPRSFSSCTKKSCVGGNAHLVKQPKYGKDIVLHQILFAEEKLDRRWLTWINNEYSVSLSCKVISQPVCTGFQTFNRNLADLLHIRLWLKHVLCVPLIHEKNTDLSKSTGQDWMELSLGPSSDSLFYSVMQLHRILAQLIYLCAPKTHSHE